MSDSERRGGAAVSQCSERLCELCVVVVAAARRTAGFRAPNTHLTPRLPALRHEYKDWPKQDAGEAELKAAVMAAQRQKLQQQLDEAAPEKPRFQSNYEWEEKLSYEIGTKPRSPDRR